MTGPTPPGTGVIAETTGLADSKSTSPTSLSPTTLIPTSTTTAPGLSISPVIRPGTPAATTTISASRVCRARSTVFEWQTVTVAFSRSSRRAAGLPTTFERPTTRPRAGERDVRALEDLDGGVRGRRQEPLVAEAEQAGVARMEAVDVLGGIERVDDGRERDPPRQRHLDDDAGDERVAVESLDSARRVLDEARPGISTSRPSMPTFSHERRIWLR